MKARSQVIDYVVCWTMDSNKVWHLIGKKKAFIMVSLWQVVATEESHKEEICWHINPVSVYPKYIP